MNRVKKNELGFSLVEIAIVMVIIGVVMAAVAIGKDTKTTADATQLFKKRVESCIAVAYGVGNWRKYDGTEIDKENGRSLKNFCKIVQTSNGDMQAKIFAPSKKLAILMHKKAFSTLSPDDFIVQEAEPDSANFTVIINSGSGGGPASGSNLPPALGSSGGKLPARLPSAFTP